MLPDYPKLKADIEQMLRSYFHNRVLFYTPGFNQIPRHTLFEGSRDAISRHEQEPEETTMHRLGAEFGITYDEMMSGNAELIFQRLDSAAREMAQKQVEVMAQTLEASCAQVGNVIDNQGKPFSPETLLNMIRMVDIDFEADGTPKMPSIIVGAITEDMRRAFAALNTDVYWKNQAEALLEDKRKEWRAREAARILD